MSTSSSAVKNAFARRDGGDAPEQPFEAERESRPLLTIYSSRARISARASGHAAQTFARARSAFESLDHSAVHAVEDVHHDVQSLSSPVTPLDVEIDLS